MKEKLLTRLLNICLILLLLSSCALFKKKGKDDNSSLKPKELKSLLLENENTFNSLRVSGLAKYSDAQQTQSFKLEIRILQDSLIWVDIADPILGLKVARAIVYKDSVAFINRLQKKYLKGSASDLQNEIGIEFGFKDAQAIFSANMIFELSKQFIFYTHHDHYLFSDYPIDEETKSLSQTEFRQVEVGFDVVKPRLQNLREPAMGRNYQIEHKSYEYFEPELLYPREMKISYLHNGQRSVVVFDIKRAETNKEGLNFPFNIPSSYEPIN